LPFSAAQDYYPLTAANDTTRYGTQYVIRMFPYSPLEYGTGSANAAWSLWVHFEDIELISAAVPATGLQAGGDVTKIEQKSKGAGPIESVALKVSKASKFLTPVPFIGQYATGLGWVADIVGNVAKVFGWSNPTNLEQEHRVIRAVSHYANNVDKLDPQSILALTTTNKIALRPSLKDNAEDQLDIANFAGRFAFISRVDWTIANTEGTELYSRDVTPAGAVVTTATFSDSYSVYTPAQWLAKNFRYWRGSMVYKLKIVKTEFHSGRIAVAFTPNSQLTTTTALTYPTSDYTYREIIDIRDMNEYTFAVPFISHTPYKTTGNDYQEDNSVGTLKIYVVDPLKCPDVVAGAVRIYVEMAGGPDFEVQQLFLTATTPITDMALQAGACEAVPKSLGSSIQTKFQLTSAADCFGERIMNLRSLVKRSHIIQRNREVTFTQPYLVVFPFMYNALETATLSATLIPWQISDLYGALASMFTYSTGSVNIKAYPATQEGFDYSSNLIGFVTPMMGDPDNVGVWSHLADVPSSLLPNTRGTESHMSRFVYGKQAFKENHAAEFSVPGYHFLRRTPNADGMIYQNIYRTTDGVIFGTANFGDKKLNKKSGLVVMVDGVGNDQVLPGGFIVSRAGGEDCDFSGFISIPPMLNNISNNP